MAEEKHNTIDWELAARILSGEADEIDRGLFNQWLSADSSNPEEWHRIKKVWEHGGDVLLKEHTDRSAAWDRVKWLTVDAKSERNVKSRMQISMIMALAISVMLISGIGWLLISNSNEVGDASSLIVSNSQLEEMVLSDGSMVTLNSGSKLECRQPFEKDERTVNLNGEGFFKVEGNRERPFVIHAGEITIRVTGTEFNVRAYPNIEITEVSVLEGQVQVLTSQSNDHLELNEGRTALFHKESGSITVQQSTDPNLLAWITKRIRFDETPLSQVANTLERVYNVDIQFADEKLTQRKLTAEFSENSLDFVLEVVCVTFNLEVRREGSTVFLSKKEANE